MTPHDVIRSTADHIRKVGQYMCRAASDLMQRAVRHDASKWSDEEYPYFEKATPGLANLTYGSPEYKQALADIKPGVQKHQNRNRHHPEFHGKNGIDRMNLADLLEMICDWKAASERHITGDIVKSIEINRDRFGMSDQVAQILLNTAVAMGMVKVCRADRDGESNTTATVVGFVDTDDYNVMLDIDDHGVTQVRSDDINWPKIALKKYQISADKWTEALSEQFGDALEDCGGWVSVNRFELSDKQVIELIKKNGSAEIFEINGELELCFNTECDFAR